MMLSVEPFRPNSIISIGEENTYCSLCRSRGEITINSLEKTCRMRLPNSICHPTLVNW